VPVVVVVVLFVDDDDVVAKGGFAKLPRTPTSRCHTCFKNNGLRPAVISNNNTISN
jgi:hypothetical protein